MNVLSRFPHVFVLAAGCSSPEIVPLAAPGGAGGGSEVGGTTSNGGSPGSPGGATSQGGQTSVSDRGGLAARCEVDQDCVEGLRCLSASSSEAPFHGGPAGGYCTKACDKQADCETGRCVKEGGAGVCLLECEMGPPLASINQALDATKCLGREDLRCDSASGIHHVCYPNCGADGQCPGRTCNLQRGLCDDAPQVGASLGQACDPAEPQSCRAVCFDVGTGAFCSERCVLGGTVIDSFDCGGIEKGLCTFRSGTQGAGDPGLCSPACKSHNDCLAPLMWCTGIGGLTGVLVENGFCFAATPCPNGSADCGGDPHVQCIDTVEGPRCVDGRFALLPDQAGEGGTGGVGGFGSQGGAGGALSGPGGSSMAGGGTAAHGGMAASGAGGS